MENQDCGRGGTGRRKGLKIPRWQRRVGSSPTARTREILQIKTIEIAVRQPPTFAGSGRLASSRPLGEARHLAIDRHSAVIRKQLDWVVEAADRIFANAFEIEIAFDEVGERAG